jgi:NADH-ubiquinone oxidoreductase chain 1
MTEHSAAIFVFFFLAEYASIILMCVFISLVLLGGYELSFYNIIYDKFIDFSILYNNLYMGIISSIILSIKSLILIYIFIWVRASFPRIRFDQLMSYCWTVLLPIIIGLIIFIPCILYTCNWIIINI